ncbi:hypothetical protein AXFE_06270 [Acidithrix ferrooxidans]|uniref:Uncharacterized protein n=1 Tax=Acidithrix ferrooxidans TaxID=1280514 RepID=A0A0D8HKV8_9ACTN|nr:hypothetical protein AXFE_06270 [Acidithrix ferrooxidans]
MFEFLETLYVVAFISAVSALPSVPGRLGNTKAPGNLACSCTFIEHFVPFGDLFQHLFWGMSLGLHEICLQLRHGYKNRVSGGLIKWEPSS